MKGFDELITQLLAIANYAKDIHYTCSGSAAYSKHLFADLLQDDVYDFIDEIKDIISTSNVPADCFEIEITESIMIDSAEKALQRINDVKKLGIKVAIDDFGTGFSSLSYLSKFPADSLKIDKSFIDVMNSTESTKQYVAAIISIGHTLNLKVISEGVEMPEQLETLKSIGCDCIQGFLWGEPMPPEEAAKLV